MRRRTWRAALPPEGWNQDGVGAVSVFLSAPSAGKRIGRALLIPLTIKQYFMGDSPWLGGQSKGNLLADPHRDGRTDQGARYRKRSSTIPSFDCTRRFQPTWCPTIERADSVSSTFQFATISIQHCSIPSSRKFGTHISGWKSLYSFTAAPALVVLGKLCPTLSSGLKKANDFKPSSKKLRSRFEEPS